jgi:hypothetical protein
MSLDPKKRVERGILKSFILSEVQAIIKATNPYTK